MPNQMGEYRNSTFLQAFCFCLTPIVRMFVRAGISFGEFSELVKAIFVDVVAKDHGSRGRPANIARISAATGISRREVSRLRRLSSPLETVTAYPLSMPARVLQIWANDSDYRESDGSVCDLPIEGTSRSLEKLVSRVRGDVPVGAIRTELLRAGCIESTDEGLVRLRKTLYLEPSIFDRLVLAARNQLFFHADTILFNTESKNQSVLRPEKIIFSENVSDADIERFRSKSFDAVEEFAERYNATVSAYDHWSSSEEKGNLNHTCGVGIFYFERFPATD